jgi:hypothetical protein
VAAAHSSCCSASTAPTSQIRAFGLVKVPTTSVQRTISRFSRSWGLLDQLPPQPFGVGGEGQDVGCGLFEVVGHRGQPVLRASTIQSYWACTLAASGWSYTLQQHLHPPPRGHWGRSPSGSRRSGFCGAARRRRALWRRVRRSARYGRRRLPAEPGQATACEIAEESQPAGAVQRS